MGTRIAATFYPHKTFRKAQFYNRMIRIAGIGLTANLLVLGVNIYSLLKDKLSLSPFKKEIKALPQVAKAIKDTLAFHINLKPFFFAGHSIPHDSIGNRMDRNTHYARMLYLLDPAMESRYKVTTILHEVLKGQTLYTIAKKYKVSVQSLMAGNDMKSTELKPGKILRIQQAEEPPGYYGIDVSSWQNTINWSRVHDDTLPTHLTFFIIKATQGKDMTDPYFKHNWEQAKTATTLLGAYHFYVSDEDPVLQANNYIKNVTLQKGDLLPIVDLEYDCANCNSLSTDKATYVRNLQTFLNLLEKHYQVKPLLYTYAYFYAENLQGNFDSYTYWIARYASTAPAGMNMNGSPPSNPPRIVMWQFSDAERIKGVVGNVDISFLPAEDLKSVTF